MQDLLRLDIIERVRLLQDMNQFIISDGGDERVWFDWITLGVPDEPTENDYKFIAEDDEEFLDVCRFFDGLVQRNESLSRVFETLDCRPLEYGYIHFTLTNGANPYLYRGYGVQLIRQLDRWSEYYKTTYVSKNYFYLTEKSTIDYSSTTAPF